MTRRAAFSAAVLAAVALGASAAAAAPDLRVCADPNNMPFSNDREEGFENRIADLVARELGMRVRYTWWAQRRGFIRNTLNANVCDVIIGLPTQAEMALTTKPYYRSTYVFVTRAADKLGLSSLDDPRLRTMRVGVQLVGDDGANAPPAHALSRRGIVRNVIGFSVYGNYAEPNPPSRIVTAVARREIDAAIAWGPLAGYFARQQTVPLQLTRPDVASDGPFLPLQFDISMAVRRADTRLKAALDAVIVRRRAEFGRILTRYNVPLVATGHKRAAR